MKKLKKIGALLLAVMMLVSLCAVAGADGTPSITNEGTNIGVTETGGAKSITFENVLKVFNPDEAEIYAPTVEYSFTIAAATSEADGVGKTVTDKNNVVAYILPGNWSGKDADNQDIKVSGTPTITSDGANYSMATDTVTAAAAGAKNAKNITVSFEDVTFPKPGIYRYKITRSVTDSNEVLETIDADVATVANKNIRYLDVYVKEDNGAATIYGYVLHDVTTDITKDTKKSSGFVDEYKTSNLVVTKTLNNDSTMEGHQFPFNVSITSKGAHITEKVFTNTTYTSSKATVGETDATITTGTALVSTPKIAHKAAVKYVGIPNGFTSSVYETNDVTGTTYNSVGTADTAAAEKAINWDGETAKSNTASTNEAANETKTVGFTNTLKEISPTGVVLRVAPYVLMLAAGIVLLVMTRRKHVVAD